MLKVGVLASGRGTNLQSIINGIEAGEVPAEIKVVISDREEAKALERAENYGIDAVYVNPQQYDTTKDFEQALLNVLAEYKVELVAMAGFMRLLSSYFIGHYRNQIMNIHPSLLPAFKGLHAQQQALDYGVKVSGCTVHFVDEGVDTGPIIKQKAVEVKSDDTEKSLAKRILNYEHQILPEVIELISKKKVVLKKDNTVRIKE